MTIRPRLSKAIADVRVAVRSVLKEARLSAADVVLVAVSGGADSLALAAATAFEAKKLNIEVAGIVVDHQLQEGSGKVADTAAETLRSLGLERVSVVAVSVGSQGGMEAAARAARYAAIEKTAAALNAKAILLGHTLNDQAETVLLGLARGSGPRSIAGMERIGGVGFTYLRPLLGVSRETTEQFCHDSGLHFWSDPQNSDEKFTRVKLRRTVIPQLEAALGGGVTEALARTAELLRADLDFVDSFARSRYELLVRTSPTALTFSVTALSSEHSAAASRVVHIAISAFGSAATKNHIDEVMQLLNNWHGQKELTLPGVRVVRQGDDLIFKSAKTLRPGAC